MEGNNSPTTFGYQILLVAFVVILTSLTNPASCLALQTAVLLRQSPTEGGVINLGEGVHYFEQYTEITLTAIPKSGWQFVCWLGEVSDATTPTTVAFVNTPKIIIAVFERAAYEFLVAEIGAKSRPAERLFPSATDYANRGGSGSIRWSWPSYRYPPLPEFPESDEFPVPQEFPVPAPEPTSQEFPVPLPEPTTAILLAMGSVCAFRKRTANPPAAD
jgi:hypothetical protein